MLHFELTLCYSHEGLLDNLDFMLEPTLVMLVAYYGHWLYQYLTFSSHGQGPRLQRPCPGQPGFVHVQARVRDHLRVHRGPSGRSGNTFIR